MSQSKMYVERRPGIQFNELVDRLQVGIYRRTPGLQGRFLFANRMLREALGYSAADVAKLKVADIFEDKKKYKLLDEKVRRQGFLNAEEIKVRTKSKKTIWCSVSATVARDQSGKIKWIDGFVQDISHQKHIEQALLESKELFRAIFESTAAAIIVTDKDEKIIAWNPFAETMLGMSKAEFFNRPVSDLYPPKEWQKMTSARARRQGMIADFETQIVQKNSSRLDVGASISILKDAEGRVIGSIAILRDITSQKMAEKKIKDSENKIRVILDNSAAGITLTDEQERIVSWNSFTEQMLGMTRKDLYLRPVSSLYPQKEWEKIRAENIRTIGSRHHLETKVIKKNGQVIDVDLSVNVLKDASGKIIGSVGILQDITEQKRVQHMLLHAKLAAEEASSAKSLFLANMSHEVRTPINTIMGMIDLTLDTQLDEEQRDNLKVAKDAADNLLSLLNDILDLSRVEAGKINLEKIEMNIRNIVASVCKGLSVLAHNKNLELVWNVESNVPEIVIGDPVRLRQVFVNLINNAIKFTHRGQITVEARVSSLSSGDCQLIFSVRDQGIGIPKDKQDRIFESFTQADDSTTRRYGGTGLGLAICRRLVDMMEGRLWVESEELKGSTFYFTGLFKVPQAGIQPRVSAAGEGETVKFDLGKDLKQLTILLAEDNVVNQKIAQKMLEKFGWTVETVENGQQVINRINQTSFDLILMDAHMPILDGLETTRLIREDEKKTGKHLPIIALTAHAMEEDKQKCLAAGMDGHISKPIDRKKLYETIESIFK